MLHEPAADRTLGSGPRGPPVATADAAGRAATDTYAGCTPATAAAAAAAAAATCSRVPRRLPLGIGIENLGLRGEYMDFATRILRWRQFAPKRWAKAANRYLPPAVSAVLVLALAWQAARLTWALIPGTPATAPPPIANPIAPEQSAPATQAIDIARIMESDFFGTVSSEPVEPVAVSVLEAPETTLNLQLRATVSEPLENSRGAAIIASGQVEKTYTVSDIIEGAGGAQLHAIYDDRVILNRAGQLETLRLPSEYTSANAGSVYAAPPIPFPDAVPTLRTVISDNASRIDEIVQVAAHIEQGRMVGFRLNPGEAPEQFEALGLQPGDVVTDINGTAMSDPSRGLQVFESLGESDAANVTIIRDGAPQILTIDTARIQSFAEEQ